MGLRCTVITPGNVDRDGTWIMEWIQSMVAVYVLVKVETEIEVARSNARSERDQLIRGSDICQY